MDLHIIPECFIDTKLVELLVPPRKRKYNHTHGNGTVATKMKVEFADDFAIGIIDDDKKVLDYADKCDLVCDGSHGLQLLKHPVANHYFVVHPPSEEWIIQLAELAGLVIKEFNLPDKPKELKDVVVTAKSDRIDTNAEKFRRLFVAIRRAQLTPILVLTHWITYLKDNPYTPDLDVLRGETDRLLADSGAAL
jgi:hypothetical protein